METVGRQYFRPLATAAAGAGLALGLASSPAHADAEACYQTGTGVCYWDAKGYPGIPNLTLSLAAPGTLWFLGDFGMSDRASSVCNNTGSWVRLWDNYHGGGVVSGWQACFAPGAGTKDMFIFDNLMSVQETPAQVPLNCTGTVTTPCCSA